MKLTIATLLPGLLAVSPPTIALECVTSEFKASNSYNLTVHAIWDPPQIITHLEYLLKLRTAAGEAINPEKWPHMADEIMMFDWPTGAEGVSVSITCTHTNQADGQRYSCDLSHKRPLYGFQIYGSVDLSGLSVPGNEGVFLVLTNITAMAGDQNFVSMEEAEKYIPPDHEIVTARWDLESTYDLGDIVQNRDSDTDPILTLPAPSGASGMLRGSGQVLFKNSIDGHDYYPELGFIPDGSSLSVRITKVGTSTPGSFSETRTFTLNCP
jgi:hypothetical protein